MLGMHLLRPSRELNRIVRFVLAYGARQFGVRLHAVGVMSNHYHLILTDPRGALPDFMELVDSLLARALNKLHGRTGQFWETGSYSDVVLETAGEVVQKIAYALCNPVAAGCVPTPDEWPGLLTPAGRIGSGTSSKVTKPPIFFRTEGAGPADGFDQAADDHRPRGRAACEIPDELELEWSLPPFFASRDEFDRGLALALRTRMAEIKAHRKEKGWSAFLGAAAVSALPITTMPSRQRKLFQLDPRRMSRRKDWTSRAEAAEVAETRGRDGFARAHGLALRDWRDGDHEVVFPEGTYKMHELYGARRRRADGRIDEGSGCGAKARRASAAGEGAARGASNDRAGKAGRGPGQERRRTRGGDGHRRGGPTAEA